MYAREVSSAERDRLEAEARASRPGFKGRPATPGQAARRAAMRANKVFVRGRYYQGREVWDVVKVEGGQSSLYARGLASVEEAVELATQCLRGRVFASLGGTRLLLSAGGAFSAPVRDVAPSPPAVLARPEGSQANTWEVRLARP